ncbi:flagellin [Cellulomonas sp. C5510]|uniref:flagellin N-terminal helical domain-containing protein n=1 Tax=Cellulomonas sp. C5510 TaxID=2871170 RepID=UPI001C95C46F|nr:flagellin [Cellulomonas sp. C5510]QZN86132.1 flagellin [Cellulomonas sp. C5510]
MGLSVNTNIAALNAYRNLSSTQNDLSKSLEKLSSGLRINRAADDAAGLAISEGLRAQIGGTTQAVRNAQDGISVVQTAEGALTETHSILQRMRTLSVQASNDGGLSSTAKGNIQDEIGELKKELTRISDTTQFNGKTLLNGSYEGVFQVGANTSSADSITVDLTAKSMSAAGLGVDNIDVTSGGSTWTFGPGTMDYAGAAPAADLSFAFGGNTYTVDAASITWAGGGTANASQAEANRNALQSAVDSALSGSGLSVKFGAYGDVTVQGPEKTAAGAAVVTGDLVADVDGAAGADTATFANVASNAGATSAIDAIDAAIQSVSKVRSQLGAVQNRFDHTINNLNVAVENLSASDSRIRDTDMASEMVSYTRASILSQAGTAMLAQAKSLPQSVLQLLQ